MCGVSHNASGFWNAACGVNVHDGGERDADDLFSRPRYLLEGLALGDGAIPKPGWNAAAEDALYGASVEGGKDGGWEMSLS